MSHRPQRKMRPGSRFICLKCLQLNNVGDGIQRDKPRPKFHVKDLYCINCDCITKNTEIRYNDFIEEVNPKLKELQNLYYINEMEAIV